MKSKKILLLLLVAAGLWSGCRQPEPPPPKPADSLADIDAKLARFRAQLEALLNRPPPPADGRPIDELKKEIQERQTRITFLQNEIDALLRERAPLEMYYHQTNR